MNELKRVIIFSTVWPEPDSSAAGVRQMQWAHFFRHLGFEVFLVSPAKEKSEKDWGRIDLPEGIHRLPLPLNDSTILDQLRPLNPDVVMFDRFILEEQFGHFVYEACPKALVLLETQDLHFVRRARAWVKEKFLSFESVPRGFYQTETAIRETASIMRADHTFVVSSFEAKLLADEFELGSEYVSWVPFFYSDKIEPKASLGFTERQDFVWIGNFRHAPNIDGLRWFRNEIWSRVRAAVPSASLKIWGAYPSEEVMSWNHQRDGISVMGHVTDLESVFCSARVNLAPLRFGAGVKGKILEGWRHGVPVVTTRVGEEGILPSGNCFLGGGFFGAGISDVSFPGVVANDPESFSKACIELYTNSKLWIEQREQIDRLMPEFSAEKIAPRIQALLDDLMQKKREGSLPRWKSKILRHELSQSHRYFSKWIEVKEKKKS